MNTASWIVLLRPWRRCRCEAEDKCCSQYEHCVSCCLKPDNEPEAHMHDIYRGRNK